ncbi:MAG: hypothetical protein WCP21_23110 [Armatimonadota bacterium]
MKTLSIILLCLIASTAFAVDEYGWHPSSLDIGGQHILTFQAGAGGLTAAQRRAVVEFRLTKALTYTQYYKTVNMSYENVEGGVAIFANGILVVTATSADATANSSTLPGLAELWGGSIKRIFEIVGPSRQLPHTAAADPGAPISLQ